MPKQKKKAALKTPKKKPVKKTAHKSKPKKIVKKLRKVGKTLRTMRKSLSSKKTVIVPLNPKTKKVVRPKTGALVVYGIKTAQGKIKVLPMPAQDYLKKDLDGLNKALSKSKNDTIVLYEHLTTKVEKGLYKKRLDKKGRRVPLRKVKLSFKKSTGKQRPVLFSVGRKVKRIQQDFLFRKRTIREEVDLKLARIIPMAEKNVYTKEINIEGATIFSTIKNIKPGISTADFKKNKINSIWVEGVVRIRNPDGSLSHAMRFSKAISQLWQFSKEIAKEVRHKLADVGYRFTSLAELESIEQEMEDEGIEAQVLRIGVLRKHAKTLIPIRPEDSKGRVMKGKPAYSVSLSLKLTGYRDPTIKKKRRKKK